MPVIRDRGASPGRGGHPHATIHLTHRTRRGATRQHRQRHPLPRRHRRQLMVSFGGQLHPHARLLNRRNGHGRLAFRLGASQRSAGAHPPTTEGRKEVVPVLPSPWAVLLRHQALGSADRHNACACRAAAERQVGVGRPRATLGQRCSPVLMASSCLCPMAMT